MALLVAVGYGTKLNGGAHALEAFAQLLHNDLRVILEPIHLWHSLGSLQLLQNFEHLGLWHKEAWPIGRRERLANLQRNNDVIGWNRYYAGQTADRARDQECG